MVQYLFPILLFCIIIVKSEDYSEINNSISRESDENPDINEVFDSAEYLDTRDDEVERNNTEYNKSNIEVSSEINLPPEEKNFVEAPVKRKAIKVVENESPKNVKSNFSKDVERDSSKNVKSFLPKDVERDFLKNGKNTFPKNVERDAPKNEKSNFSGGVEVSSKKEESDISKYVERDSLQDGESDSPKDVKSDFPSGLHVPANITKFRKKTYIGTSSKNKKANSEEKSCKNSTVVNFPYTVSIQRKGSHYATGALLNDQTVLTSAAEFYHVRESIKLYRVRLGTVDCKKGGVVLPIKRITIHPYFVLGSPSFDLAVIKLSGPVALTENIKPIPMSNVTKRVISAKFMTTYWPRLIVHGHSLPKSAEERVKHHSMRISTQRMIPWKSCYSFMESADVPLDSVSLCLKPIVTHHSLCTPDPGAPVIADDVLWGITSGWTSELCKSQPSPTVFTRVALKSVRKWLHPLL